MMTAFVSMSVHVTKLFCGKIRTMCANKIVDMDTDMDNVCNNFAETVMNNVCTPRLMVIV